MEFTPSDDYSCPQCGSNNTVPLTLPEPRDRRNSIDEKFGGEFYKPIEVEEIETVGSGTMVVFDYTIEDKPVIRNTPSIKPLEFKPRFFRFNVWTEFNIRGIKAKYYGPLLVKKGEKVQIWGIKHRSEFIIDGAETEERIFKSY
jgi:hypothetical protein